MEPSLSVQTFVRSFLLVSTFTPASLLSGQDTAPRSLADVETARSRACVSAVARVDALNRDLLPLMQRAERIRALAQAVQLEDSAEAAPFDTSDPVEAAVAAWFEQDAALGRQWAQSQDSAVDVRRSEAREAILTRLRTEVESVGTRGQERLASNPELQQESRRCEGVIFVRPAVLEVCDTTTSPLCGAARDSAGGGFRFVDSAEDIWDVEELRPWSDPAPLAVTPQGGLGGARTAVRARRGNVTVTVGVAPMIRERSALSAEQAGEFDANLDSLGFTFQHPLFVMAPALEIQLRVPAPLGGETHYLLHFGDLSDPLNQVVWTVPAGSGGPIQAMVPAGGGALARLNAGETLSLTAVIIPDAEGEGAAEGEAVYTIPLVNVNQSRAVGSLLGYMAGGQLGQDLARLVPPSGTGG